MSATIAVFGATGATGSHVVKYALEKGYKVQAMARTPSKVTVQDPNLTVIKGDFEDTAAISATVKGATYVICCAGGNLKVKPYVKLMMPFAERLWPILDAEPSVKVFLYQAGALSPGPGKKLSMGLKMMKSVAGCLIGLGPMIDDNDNVLDFMAANPKSSFQVIVTRPGGLKEAESCATLVASDTSHMGMITFVDLAHFTVEAVEDKSLFGKHPYPVPKK